MGDLGERMKGYERATHIELTRRMPLIIRIDGKAFHSYTKGLDRPFDPGFVKAMHGTAQNLFDSIDGSVMAYTQSDEISLVLVDYNKFATAPWFGKDLQKVVSVSASMATYFFGLRSFEWLVQRLGDPRMATFDSRAFVIPREEVGNYFVWRQQDAIRNSLLSLAQAHFSHTTLQGMRRDALLAMLADAGHPWEDLPLHLQRGTTIDWSGQTTPLFSDNNQRFVHSLVYPGDEEGA
jgi:tRNA(His) guanylyltransferase